MEELEKVLTENGVTPDELLEWLKSESVYACLRRGVKSPSSTGVDDCEDSHYYDLYNFTLKLK